MEKLARNFNLMGLSVSRTTRGIEIDETILKKTSGLEYESFQPLHAPSHSTTFHRGEETRDEERRYLCSKEIEMSYDFHFSPIRLNIHAGTSLR